MISPQHLGGIKGGKKCELTNSGCSRDQLRTPQARGAVE